MIKAAAAKDLIPGFSVHLRVELPDEVAEPHSEQYDEQVTMACKVAAMLVSQPPFSNGCKTIYQMVWQASQQMAHARKQYGPLIGFTHAHMLQIHPPEPRQPTEPDPELGDFDL